jgi:hypothetical protein
VLACSYWLRTRRSCSGRRLSGNHGLARCFRLCSVCSPHEKNRRWRIWPAGSTEPPGPGCESAWTQARRPVEHSDYSRNVGDCVFSSATPHPQERFHPLLVQPGGGHKHSDQLPCASPHLSLLLPISLLLLARMVDVGGKKIEARTLLLAASFFLTPLCILWFGVDRFFWFSLILLWLYLRLVLTSAPAEVPA